MPKIISEIGVNHDGNFDIINEMIRQSKLAGADCIKIQLYTSKLVFGDDSRKKNEFTYEQVKRIKALCTQHDIGFLATVNDPEKLEWCEALGQSEYKVSSLILKRDVAFVKSVVDTGKVVYVPLGMWGGSALPFTDKNVRYLYCLSKYPTYWDSFTDFPEQFNGKPFYGFSDHSYGIAACLMAMARGARVVEKHFTLNKMGQCRDNIGSMSYDELKILCSYGRELAQFQNVVSSSGG